MKNTVGKGLFFYILIFLGVIVGVACIFMAILVLSPGTELFGISYYYQDEFKWNDSYIDTNNEEVTKKVDTINYLRTSDGITYFQKLIKENHKFKFVINTGYTRVHVLQDTSSTHIGMRISGRVTGISKSDSKKDSSVTANYTYDSANDCYEFVLSIVEPEIVLPFSKAITIDFFIPDSIDLSKVDFEIKKLIDEAYNLTKKTLTEKRDALEAVAKGLLEYETLSGDDVKKYPTEQVDELGKVLKDLFGVVRIKLYLCHEICTYMNMIRKIIILLFICHYNI